MLGLVRDRAKVLGDGVSAPSEGRAFRLVHGIENRVRACPTIARQSPDNRPTIAQRSPNDRPTNAPRTPEGQTDGLATTANDVPEDSSAACSRRAQGARGAYVSEMLFS